MLGTILDVPGAIDWLRSTFFYVRVHQHPGKRCGGAEPTLRTGLQPYRYTPPHAARYGVPPDAALLRNTLERWLRDQLLLGSMKELAQHGLVGAAYALGGHACSPAAHHHPTTRARPAAHRPPPAPSYAAPCLTRTLG